MFIAVYSLSSNERTLHAFTYAFMVNVFPLAFMPYMSMDEARLGGVPLAYMPIVAAGIVYVLKCPAISKRCNVLAFLMLVYVFYITFNAFYQRFLIGTLVYYFSWMINFVFFLCIYNFFTKLDKKDCMHAIDFFFKVLVISCLVGWGRFFLGLSPDANFMPMVNRNGTVVFLIMVAPLLFFLGQLNYISKRKIVFTWFVLLITLILMQSRSGLIGFTFITVVYYIRPNLRSLVSLSLALSLFTIVLLSPLGNKIQTRLIDAQKSISTLSSGDSINQGEKDYARYMLLNAAWTIFENNKLFGAGIGVPNYRAEFKEHVSFFDRNSKAHNFYLSYLAELGVIGFTILLLVLVNIYKLLAPLSSDFRAFKVSFIGIALMMTMNEYILLPELWCFFGMLGGISYVVNSET